MHPAVEAYIAKHSPSSVLECSLEPSAQLARFCHSHGIQFAAHAPSQVVAGTAPPADLVIVHTALEQLPPARGRELLGYLRNVLAHRIWLLLAPDSSWTLADLIALGFRKDANNPDLPFTSYTYDLNTYNHKRTWNNPRFWANPENFHKHRW